MADEWHVRVGFLEEKGECTTIGINFSSKYCRFKETVVLEAKETRTFTTNIALDINHGVCCRFITPNPGETVPGFFIEPIMIEGPCISKTLIFTITNYSDEKMVFPPSLNFAQMFIYRSLYNDLVVECSFPPKE